MSFTKKCFPVLRCIWEIHVGGFQDGSCEIVLNVQFIRLLAFISFILRGSTSNPTCMFPWLQVHSLTNTNCSLFPHDIWATWTFFSLSSVVYPIRARDNENGKYNKWCPGTCICGGELYAQVEKNPTAWIVN